jgi:NAD(P)-dependent dehydrogenase (short-subunit alcohol dehydrogenase family)
MTGLLRRHPYATASASASVAALLGWRVFRRVRALDLRDKVVLVTGGSRGLGLHLARVFARQGARLAICARDEEELARARADLEPRGAEVVTLRCDVRDRAAVEDMVAETTHRLGPVDVLVNNAGIIQVGPVETMDIDDFRRAMDTNFWGTVYATMAVLPEMRRRKEGRIVNITSIGAEVAMPHLLPYDCAKFAALGFSEGMHAELAADGIVVTTVIPGLMRTGGHRHAFFKGQHEHEYTWFTAGEHFPLLSMSPTRAAKRIVEACRRGEAIVTLTWQAKLLRVAHAVLPGFTDDLLGIVHRVLPSSAGAGAQTALRGETVAPVGP